MKRKIGPWIRLACFVVDLFLGLFYLFIYLKITEMINNHQLLWIARILSFPIVMSIWIISVFIIELIREELMNR